MSKHPMSDDLRGDANEAISHPKVSERVIRAADELDRMHAIVDRLQKTADGVRALPEDVLYVAGTVSGHLKVRVTMVALGPLGRVFISDCYSTPEAAEAAREASSQ